MPEEAGNDNKHKHSVLPGWVRSCQEVSECWSPGDTRVPSDLFWFPTLSILVLPFTCMLQAFLQITPCSTDQDMLNKHPKSLKQIF